MEPQPPHDESTDESTEASMEESRDQELDALRIRRVARGRQAVIRYRSYCLIAALAAAVETVDLLWRAVRRYRLLHEVIRPGIYVAAAVMLGWVAARLLVTARSLNVEARRRLLAEPQAAPDFSSLSDGSQIVKNLERIE